MVTAAAWWNRWRTTAWPGPGRQLGLTADVRTGIELS
jgi:hypothetical protein